MLRECIVLLLLLSGVYSEDGFEKNRVVRENSLLRQMYVDSRSGKLCVSGNEKLKKTDEVCASIADFPLDLIRITNTKRELSRILKRMQKDLREFKSINKKFQNQCEHDVLKRLEVLGHYEGLCAREDEYGFICEKRAFLTFEESREEEYDLLGDIHDSLRKIDALRTHQF